MGPLGWSLGVRGLGGYYENSWVADLVACSVIMYVKERLLLFIHAKVYLEIFLLLSFILFIRKIDYSTLLYWRS